MITPKPFYQPERFYTPSAERKWISRYSFEGEELQNLQQQNIRTLYSEILDLTVAQTFINPLVRNVPGRAMVIYGLTSATAYDPVANTGIETVAANAFVFCRFQSTDVDAGMAIKHNRGFRGDFSQIFLSWPAQSGVKARLVIYQFDEMPWQNGEAAT